jgi:hypothetical protein
MGEMVLEEYYAKYFTSTLQDNRKQGSLGNCHRDMPMTIKYNVVSWMVLILEQKRTLGKNEENLSKVCTRPM